MRMDFTISKKAVGRHKNEKLMLSSCGSHKAERILKCNVVGAENVN